MLCSKVAQYLVAAVAPYGGCLARLIQGGLYLPVLLIMVTDAALTLNSDMIGFRFPKDQVVNTLRADGVMAAESGPSNVV